MDGIQNLLILYAGLLLISSMLSGALWAHTRNRLYRALFFVWASMVLSFVLQGALTRNMLVITLAFSSSFLVNLALAFLVARSTGVPLAWRRYVAIMAGPWPRPRCSTRRAQRLPPWRCRPRSPYPCPAS